MFSTMVPLVPVVGTLYFLFKHIADAFNLLTVHRKEIESSSGMIMRLVLCEQLCLILFQVCMCAYMISTDHYAEGALIFLTALISGFITFQRGYFTTPARIARSESSFRESRTRVDSLLAKLPPKIRKTGEFSTESPEKSAELQKVLAAWRLDYAHPLILGDAAQNAYERHQLYRAEIVVINDRESYNQ